MQVSAMFKVNSKKCLTLLSKRSLKQNKTRNIVAVIAIVLTTVLFTSVFSIGMSIMDSLERSTMRQVGTEAHGGFKFLTQEQYDIVKADPKIKDISYNILIGFGENPEFKKTYVEIRWTEEKAAAWSFNLPTTGTLPKEKMDIATTTNVLDALGLPHELGVQVPLEFTANGVKYQDTFTLCGFWDMDVVMGANEAFLSREYADLVAPVWHESRTAIEAEDNSWMAGSINPALWFNTSWDIEGQMEDLKNRCGFGPEVNEGVNWAYAGAEMDLPSLILMGGLLAIIMFSGYLIIYNIFYISVSKDIKFYGLLKTIGTTNRQLKKIVRRQALLLSAIGIPLGLIFSYALSFALVPLVISISNLAESYVISANWLIFAGGALFTLATVWVSCIKPCAFVSKISPMEAVRYNEAERKHRKTVKRSKKSTPFSMAAENMKRTPKKAIAVILSLSLSLVCLNGTVTLVKGFDMDKYIQNSVVSDFHIADASLLNNLSAAVILNGVTPEDMAEIATVPGLTEMGSVYMREHWHKLSAEAYQNAQQICDEYQDELPMPYVEEYLRLLNEEQKISAHLYGIDDFIMDKMEIVDGEMDWEKFKSGDYLVATAFTNLGNGRYYDIGDKVTIDYGDGKVKEYEVMAIGNIPYALSPQHGHFLDIYFTMYAEEFIRQTGEHSAMKTAFDVTAEEYDNAEKWVQNYCENVNSDLNYKSRSLYVEEFKSTQNVFLAVGGLLSFILALIGILNFINSMLTSVESRKRELAVLQAIGMSGRQLKMMLIGEGILYIAGAVLLVLVLGTPLDYLLVQALAAQMWFFTYHFTIWPLIFCLPLLIIVAVTVPWICYKNICQKTVVDRLRE